MQRERESGRVREKERKRERGTKGKFKVLCTSLPTLATGKELLLCCRSNGRCLVACE